ncbi:MAG: D-2-hydroxyacid dehydrogenase [Chloroflexota bacterium]
MPIILLGFKEHRLPHHYRTQIQQIAPDYELVVTPERAQIEAVLDDIEIAFRTFPHDLLDKAPDLRWFQCWGAGVDWIQRYPELIENDLIITNASGVHAVPISEHIMAFLLAFARGFPEQMRNQVQSKWAGPQDRNSLFELEGKTMLLIGVGAIGARTAKLANAHDMKVIGVLRNPSRPVDFVEQMISRNDLLNHLPQADFVVLTVPLTTETRGMIGEAELRAMKESAYIINIGRGSTIQQEKLIQALQEGWIAGAGLDVVENEPLAASSPLWAMPNVILTAHYSGLTPQYTERIMEIFLDNLGRYVRGEGLRNVVDKGVGY